MSKRDAMAAEPVVRIDSEVTRCVRQHARAHPKTEVCGVLIGDNESGAIEVRASIEGINAAQAGTHVTFTQDAWEAIYRVKDERYPDDRIVGWYHSHPGFGVFLSEHDMFIQENFFSSRGQIAWVYDPHTDEEGCFGWVGDEVHRITALSITDANGDGTERTPKQIESSLEDSESEQSEDYLSHSTRRPAPAAWARWTVSIFSYLATLVLGFAVCYLLFPRLIALVPDPVTGRVLALVPDPFTGKVTVEDGGDLLPPSLNGKLLSDPAQFQDPFLPPLGASPGKVRPAPTGAAAAQTQSAPAGKPQPAPAAKPQPAAPAQPSTPGGHP